MAKSKSTAATCRKLAVRRRALRILQRAPAPKPSAKKPQLHVVEGAAEQVQS